MFYLLAQVVMLYWLYLNAGTIGQGLILLWLTRTTMNMVGDTMSSGKQNVLTSRKITTSSGEDVVQLDLWNPHTFGRVAFVYDPADVDFDFTIVTPYYTNYRNKAVPFGRQASRGVSLGSTGKKEIVFIESYRRPASEKTPQFLRKLQIQFILTDKKDPERVRKFNQLIEKGEIRSYAYGSMSKFEVVPFKKL